MLNDDKIEGNIEVKTPSPPFSSADRSINKDEENLLKSGSSSNGNSLLDLKERLQRLPFPRKTIRLANCANNVSFRFSYKRNACFHGGTHSIEENIERKGKKEEGSLLANKVEIKGARARRRAKLLLLSDQTVVFSKHSKSKESNTNFNKEQAFNKSSMIENRLPFQQYKQQSSLTGTLSSPLSERTLTTFSPYRKHDDPSNDSSRSQLNPPILRVCSSVSCQNSPKSKINLPPLSPISLGKGRPMKFGGYRPQTGVILQNLSSSSEPESNYEVLPIHQIEGLINIKSPPLSNRSVQHLNTQFMGLSSNKLSASTGNVNISRKNISPNIHFTEVSTNAHLIPVPLSPLKTTNNSTFNQVVNTFKENVEIELPYGNENILSIDSPERLPKDFTKSNKQFTEIQTAFSMADSLQPSKNISKDLILKVPPENTLEQDNFKYAIDYDNEENKLVLSAETNYKRVEDKANVSEDNDAAPVIKEFPGEEFSVKQKQHVQQCTNIPTLILNSQEMSYASSPITKISSERCLDTDALSVALSNILKQRKINDTSINECSKSPPENNYSVNKNSDCSSLNTSRASYGSFRNKKSKIPIKVSTIKSKSNEVTSQKISSHSERYNQESSRARSSAASNLEIKEQNYESVQTLTTDCRLESDRTIEFSQPSEHLVNFNQLTSSISDSSANETSSREQSSKRFKSDNSKRINLALKNVHLEDLLSLPQTENIEVTQNEAYRINFNNAESSCESSGRLTIGDTFENLSDKGESRKSCDKSDLREKESSNQSNNYEIRYSNIYNRESKKETLTEKQIGDGSCQETSLDSWSGDEEIGRKRRTIHHRDKFQFSLEKLAAEQFRRNLCAERTETIQSNTGRFYSEKMYDNIHHASSTSKLCHTHEFKKKSQDRFPFTISEKNSVSSIKYKLPGQLTNLKQDKLPDRNYKLDTHPSITRLADSGFDDRAAGIIDCVTHSEQTDREDKSYGMKGFIQRFSARLRRSKRRDQIQPNTKTARIIYKNRAYQEEYDNVVASYSESSLLKELKLYKNMEGQRLTIADSPDKQSSIISDKNKYDSNNLRSRKFENPDPGNARQNIVEEAWTEINKCKSARDPYSVFFVNNTEEISAREFLPKPEEKNIALGEKRRNRIKVSTHFLTRVSTRFDEKEPAQNRKFRNIRKNGNFGNGCFCLRFYRMIVPVSFRFVPKYRSCDNPTSINNKSHFSLRRKKV